MRLAVPIPALKPFVIIPVPAPSRALHDGPDGGTSDGAGDVVGLDVHGVRIREPAVVALAHDRDDDRVPHALVRCDGDLHGSVVDAADGVRGREVDGRLEHAPLGDLPASR